MCKKPALKKNIFLAVQLFPLRGPDLADGPPYCRSLLYNVVIYKLYIIITIITTITWNFLKFEDAIQPRLNVILRNIKNY
jgi:hypothetical protein